jgi:regulator of sigma E protease
MEFFVVDLGGRVCVVLLFSLAIFIHEFGHFLAARWLGLKVDAFAIGFGPALWKRTVGGRGV